MNAINEQKTLAETEKTEWDRLKDLIPPKEEAFNTAKQAWDDRDETADNTSLEEAKNNAKDEFDTAKDNADTQADIFNTENDKIAPL